MPAMASADRILVADLTVDCVCGDLPHEREIVQRIHLDLSLAGDFRAAARSDDLRDAVDYVRAAEVATRVAIEGRFRLLETLADRVAAALLAAFPALAEVTVKTWKTSCLSAATAVGVEVTRGRGTGR